MRFVRVPDSVPGLAVDVLSKLTFPWATIKWFNLGIIKAKILQFQIKMGR